MNDIDDIIDVPEFLAYINSPAKHYHSPTKFIKNETILKRIKLSPLSQEITQDVDEYVDIFKIDIFAPSFTDAEYFLPLDDFPYDAAEESFVKLLQRSDKFIKYKS